jgi:mono/diheme cytochrome c family protein
MRLFRPHHAGLALAAFLSMGASAQVVTANAPGRLFFTEEEKFPLTTGVEIYEGVCQSCHMPQGKGAMTGGAGAYPALATNKNLASATYVIYTVIKGRKAMPPFGNALDDTQVAQVANYIRGQFGNRYAEAITPADVKAARAQ